jgi:hypothetical protein
MVDGVLDFADGCMLCRHQLMMIRSCTVKVQQHSSSKTCDRMQSPPTPACRAVPYIRLMQRLQHSSATTQCAAEL